jgi:DNA-directed RNA polymerase specialized sigma24 family protein
LNFSEFYREFYPRLYHFLQWRFQDLSDQEREDCVQEAFTRAYASTKFGSLSVGVRELDADLLQV